MARPEEPTAGDGVSAERPAAPRGVSIGAGEDGEAATHRRLPRNVWLLGWASLLNDVASEMIYPLLPNFVVGVLGGSRTMLGLIEGVAETISSLLKLIAGGWSDRVRRRKAFVVSGYALAAVARPLMAVARSPWDVFALRTADRTGKGIRTAPRDAVIAESTGPDVRGAAFGLHRAMDHLGAALGPVLATVFLWWRPDDLRSLFALTAVPGACAVGLLWWGLREPAPGPSPAAGARTKLSEFAPSFRWYLVALVLFTLGNSPDAFLLLRAEELGVAKALLPTLWFGFHVAKSGGNALGGRLVDRLGARGMLLAGWFVYAAVYAGFGAADALWHVPALFLAYAIYFGLAEPAEKTLVAELVGAERKGAAYGWFNAAIGIVALPSAVIFGALYDRFGPPAAFGWGAAMAFAGAVTLSFVRPARTASAG
ncbi:MAG: MFS transporter [Planctomycetota bacterium]|nr:MAG: MFS transporter [Planctomycetota bacterium]